MPWSVMSTPRDRRLFSRLEDDSAAMAYCIDNMGKYVYYLHSVALMGRAFKSPIEMMEPAQESLDEWKFNVKMSFVRLAKPYVGLVPMDTSS